jgi:hypothetical protein
MFLFDCSKDHITVRVSCIIATNSINRPLSHANEKYNEIADQKMGS